MAGVQVTVEIPAEKLAQMADNIFDGLDDKTRAEIVAKTVTDVMKSPDMIRKEAEEQAALSYRRNSYEYDKQVNRLCDDIRKPILDACYNKAMKQVYEDMKNNVMESKEMKNLMKAVTEEMTKNCKEIMIAVMHRAMVSQMQGVLATVDTLNSNAWCTQASLDSISDTVKRIEERTEM